MFEKLQAGEKIHDAPGQPRTCTDSSIIWLLNYTQDTIKKSPIVVPSIPRPSSSCQKSQKTTPSKTSKKTSSAKAKLSHKLC